MAMVLLCPDARGCGVSPRMVCNISPSLLLHLSTNATRFLFQPGSTSRVKSCLQHIRRQPAHPVPPLCVLVQAEKELTARPAGTGTTTGRRKVRLESSGRITLVLEGVDQGSEGERCESHMLCVVYIWPLKCMSMPPRYFMHMISRLTVVLPDF
jgi:hypothetical protein